MSSRIQQNSNMDDITDKEVKTSNVSDETINEILELDTDDVAVEELIKDDLSPKHRQSKVRNPNPKYENGF